MSFPINSMVIFHSYVAVYQRVVGDFISEAWDFQRCPAEAQRMDALIREVPGKSNLHAERR